METALYVLNIYLIIYLYKVSVSGKACSVSSVHRWSTLVPDMFPKHISGSEI